MFRLCTQGAGHIDNIRHYGGSGWLCACTGTVIQGGPYRIPLHLDGIHHAVHIGNQTLVGDHCGMHPQLNAFIGLASHTQMLNAITQLVGILHICRGYFGDTFGIDLVELQGNTKG